jgi:hypothetical protein
MRRMCLGTSSARRLFTFEVIHADVHPI